MRKPQAAIPEDLLAEIVAMAEQIGCELAHIAFQDRTLKIILDRLEGGVTIDDCATVSRQVSALLDVSDAFTGKYTLEVSSPGLDRELHEQRDFERFEGSLARITFHDPESGAKKTVVGRLTGLVPGESNEKAVTGLLEEPGDKRYDIALRDIKTDRL